MGETNGDRKPIARLIFINLIILGNISNVFARADRMRPKYANRKEQGRT